MSRIKWHRDDHERILSLLHTLTLEEAGAELFVRTLIVANGDQLPDDDRFLAGFLRLGIRRWRQIKKRLFEMGAFFNENGFIRAPGLTDVIHEIREKIDKKVNAGRISGQSRRRKAGASTSLANDLKPTGVPSSAAAADQETKSKTLSPLRRESLTQSSVSDCAAETRVSQKGLEVFRKKVGEAKFDRWLGEAELIPGDPPRLLVPHERLSLVQSHLGADARLYFGQDVVIAGV
jgi:uncharacterized protein YdaU (DUF1376 family)